MKNKLLVFIMLFLLIEPFIAFSVETEFIPMETELTPFDDYLSEEIGDVYTIEHPEIKSEEREDMEEMGDEYPLFSG